MATADQVGDQPGPAGLVRRPEPGAVVAVEVLEEQHWSRQRGSVCIRSHAAEARAAPVRRRRGRSRPAGAHRSSATRVEGRRGARSRWGTRPSRSSPKKSWIALERGHGEEIVDRKPHRAAPVRVAAEHRRRRLGGLVVDARADALELAARTGGRGGRRTATAARAAKELRRVEQRRRASAGPGRGRHADQQPPLPVRAAQDPRVPPARPSRAARGGAGSRRTACRSPAASCRWPPR